MNKTILIGIPNTYTKRVKNKWVLIASGLFFVPAGIYHILLNQSFYIVIGIMWIIVGLYHFFNGILLIDSKFAPKVKVDERMIELKNNLWKPSIKSIWIEMSSIRFNPYEVVFQLEESLISFSYNTDSELSIEIKKTIREIAEYKNIQIIGG